MNNKYFDIFKSNIIKFYFFIEDYLNCNISLNEKLMKL